MASECLACHNNLVTPVGEDVSIGASWRGSMMANSARDPYVLASVRREMTDHPHIAAEVEDECAACHTLVTSARGPDGAIIGSLPEQMTFQEWRHSDFHGEQRSCQSCHMPRAVGPIRVSSVLGEPRESLARHTFLGGNAFMLRLMNRFRDELGIEATPAELEGTARATVRQLEQATATVSIERVVMTGSTLELDVAVRNLTGHKFPTGYPSRRAWLHVAVRDGDGRALFESDRVAATGLVEGHDSDAAATGVEPHFEEITRPDQVQTYESVMGTPSGAPTTGLEATQYLKDNRLLPRGFDKQTAAMEIGIVGAAADDPDFNGEGDRIRYRVVAAGAASVDVVLRYQPTGYRWARNLARYETVEPTRFVAYDDAVASASSVAVARASSAIGALGRARTP